MLNNPEYNTSWYKLLIPEDELKIRNYEDYRRFEKIAVALLIKYFDRLYYLERNRWESMVVGYELVAMSDEGDNFLNEEKDEYTISISNTDENEAMITWLKRIIEKVNEAKAKNKSWTLLNNVLTWKLSDFQLTYMILCFIWQRIMWKSLYHRWL